MNEQTFYTIPEAAKKLRVTRAAIYKWMKQGRLGFVVVGSERRITGSAIDAFIASGGDRGIDTNGNPDVQSEDIKALSFATQVR